MAGARGARLVPLFIMVMLLGGIGGALAEGKAGMAGMAAFELEAGTAGSAPPMPCRDPRGCPDITVDPATLIVGTQRPETFGMNSCAVQEGLVVPGTRHIIRLSISAPNQGEGSLIIGRPQDSPDHFEWSGCHDHWHFTDFAHYRVWTPSGFLAWDDVRRANPDWTASEAFANHPELLAEVVTGHKQGFCIMDFAPAQPTIHGAAPPDPLPKYHCGSQGISRGWADTYVFTLDGQWVDVTGLPPGAYVLEAEVNPERVFLESAYGNNRAAVPVAVVPLA
jgi:hypothetical protein